MKSESEQISFLESEALGLMAFSYGAYSDKQSFEHTLECDVRGEVTVQKEIIQVKVGEIKSGKDRKKSNCPMSQEALHRGVSNPLYI